MYCQPGILSYEAQLAKTACNNTEKQAPRVTNDDVVSDNYRAIPIDSTDPAEC
jgi:hypothetical protein